MIDTKYTDFEERVYIYAILICLPITVITAPLIIICALLYFIGVWKCEQSKMEYMRHSTQSPAFNVLINGLTWPVLPCIYCIFRENMIEQNEDLCD